jgi:hypothetical protein
LKITHPSLDLAMSRFTDSDTGMAKRKASISSEPDTIEILRSKLAKAEGKKAAKKPRSSKPKKSLGTKQLEVLDNGKSDEENIDPAGAKRTVLVRWVSHHSLPFLYDKLILLDKHCSWSDKTLYYLTDSLLSLIEDSETWRQAFGFIKASSDINTGQGKKTHEHYVDLTAKLFHDVESPDEWRDVAIKELAIVVKTVSPSMYLYFYSGFTSYIIFCSMKKAFRKHRETLKETGHGLIANGDEASIHPGSEIANAWGMFLFINVFIYS